MHAVCFLVDHLGASLEQQGTDVHQVTQLDGSAHFVGGVVAASAPSSLDCHRRTSPQKRRPEAIVLLGHAEEELVAGHAALGVVDAARRHRPPIPIMAVVDKVPHQLLQVGPDQDVERLVAVLVAERRDRSLGQSGDGELAEEARVKSLDRVLNVQGSHGVGPVLVHHPDLHGLAAHGDAEPNAELVRVADVVEHQPTEAEGHQGTPPPGPRRVSPDGHVGPACFSIRHSGEPRHESFLAAGAILVAIIIVIRVDTPAIIVVLGVARHAAVGIMRHSTTIKAGHVAAALADDAVAIIAAIVLGLGVGLMFAELATMRS